MQNIFSFIFECHQIFYCFDEILNLVDENIRKEIRFAIGLR